MSPQGMRLRPRFDALEDRLALSSGLSNTLGVATGVVSSPGAVAEVSAPVSSKNIGGRSSIVIGEEIAPAPGSSLEPKAVAAYGPNGERLQVSHGAPFIPGVHGGATYFVQVSTPGPVTLAVTGKNGTTGAFQVTTYLPGDVNGDGQVTLADLKAFTPHYLQNINTALYDPLADANMNGQVGMEDAKFLLRNLTPLTPPGKMFITLALAPGEALLHNHSGNSGGVTNLRTVTIVGQTVPGSFVFTDSGLGDYSFTGPVLATDARGRFSVTVTNTSGINNNDFLAISPYGQHMVKDQPIFWTAYAAPGPKP